MTKNLILIQMRNQIPHPFQEFGMTETGQVRERKSKVCHSEPAGGG